MMDIKNVNGIVLYRSECNNLRDSVIEAVKARADLSGADLSGADLSGADLYEANLYEANLYEANLYGADLFRITVSWTSHDLVAEILKRAAHQDVPRRMIAGLVLVSRDWCWNEFLAADIPANLRKWALTELRKWVKAEDDAPECLIAGMPGGKL